MDYIESLHTLKNEHLLQWMILKEMLKNKEEANRDVVTQRGKVKELYDKITDQMNEKNYPLLARNFCYFPANKKCQGKFKNNFTHWTQNGNVCFSCAYYYNTP